MADPDSAARPAPACADAVAGSLGDVTWTVRGGHWDALPAEVAALVAPPLEVSARSWAGPAPAAAPVPPGDPARQPDPRTERRLELVLFPPDRAMIGPGQARAGRHRRPARAS